MSGELFLSFNRYLRGTFGVRVHRLSIDAGFSCPNIDGTLDTAGCVFCNNRAFSRHRLTVTGIAQQIEDSMAFYRKRFKAEKFVAYFQSYTNTHADPPVLRERYDIIRRYPDIVGLFISTRPDCVDDARLDVIASYVADYLVWVEYGLQTTDDTLLAAMNRRHTYADFLRAVDLTARRGINVGAHLMVGFPGMTRESTLADIGRMAALPVAGVKFHVFHVLKDTPMEARLDAGEISVMGEREFVSLASDCLERLPPDRVILRLVSTAGPDYLRVPQWINRRDAVTRAVLAELARRGTRQGSMAE